MCTDPSDDDRVEGLRAELCAWLRRRWQLEDAEDGAQECWAILLAKKSPPAGIERRKLAFGIVRVLHLRHRKQHSTFPMRSLEALAESAGFEPSTQEQRFARDPKEPDETPWDPDVEPFLRQLNPHLSRRQVDVAYRFFQLGMSVGQISTALHVEWHHARGHLEQILKKLRKVGRLG